MVAGSTRRGLIGSGEAKLALEVTQEVLTLNRGRIAHHGPSAALPADPARLDEYPVDGLREAFAGLRKRKYRPCSRNPIIAQSLSYFHRIEDDQMENRPTIDRQSMGTDRCWRLPSRRDLR